MFVLSGISFCAWYVLFFFSRQIFPLYFMRRINKSLFLMERTKCRRNVWYYPWPIWNKRYHVPRLSPKLSWQRQLHMDTEYWRSKGQCDLLDFGLENSIPRSYYRPQCDDYLKVSINIYVNCISIVLFRKLNHCRCVLMWLIKILILKFWRKIEEVDPCCFTVFKRCDRGEFKPFNITAIGNYIMISFVSDDRHNAAGFKLTWKGNLRDLFLYWIHFYVKLIIV